MEPAKSVEERLTALEIFKEEVSKTTKVRFVGADKLSKRGLELHTSSREFWRLKLEVCDLLLESLDPLLLTLFPEESKRTAVRNEFKECLCLSHVEYINGIFPAGGEWGKERAIDLRMRYGCVSCRFDHLVRTVLSPALKAAPGPVRFQMWVPLTQHEMKKRQERREKTRERSPRRDRGGRHRRT